MDDARFASVIPNPVKENFALNFRLLSSSRVTIRVCDILGKPVSNLGSYGIEKGTNSLSLTLPPLASGYYILRVEGERESVSTGFIVK